MGIEVSASIAAPVEQVFSWHARPGAVRRLTPPWQSISVVVEADSLRDGRAVLSLPAGVRWVARHDPAGYEPPYRFVDQLAGGPLGRLLSWRHTHDFAPDGDGTRLTDRVDTAVPAAVLRPIFGYRHRQLTDDLAAHGWGRQLDDRGLTVAVTGASGTVGRALVPFLTTGGHRVVRLVRRTPQGPGERQWSPEQPADDLLDGVDALVHLAGAGIAGRFTEAHKRAIRATRVGPTHRLAELAARRGVTTLVTASAIGYYGPNRGGETLTEASARGDGYLAEVVADWEDATAPAREAGVRTVSVRTGIVQTPRGGVLRLQRRLFNTGLGGRLGTGDQWLSWIAVDDLVDIYYRALLDPALTGPVNAVAPEPVRNRDYTRTLAHVLRRPAILPVPAAGPRLLLGEQGLRELALASQRVRPAALAARGHHFRWPDLGPALRHLLGRTA